MKKIFFITVIILLTHMVYAEKNNQNELAFIEAFRRSDITEMENILKQKSYQMELSALLETIFKNYLVRGDYNGHQEHLNTNSRLLVPSFQLLIKYGADVNYNNTYYYWLLKENANVWTGGLQRTELPKIYINDNKSISLLYDIVFHHNSFINNNQQTKLQLARLLLEAGANPNAMDWYNLGREKESWFYDDQIALARLFIEHGLDINKPTFGDIYPLYMSVVRGQFGCVRLLVESGAKVNQISRINPYGYGYENITAAQEAYSKGEIDIYNYLKQHGATWSPPVNVANTPTPSQPSPQVSSQPSQQPRQTYNDSYDYSPPPSSSRSSSSSSSSGSTWADVGKAITEAFKSPLQSGTYSSVGTKNTLRLTAIAKSGMFSYNVQGQTGTGTYEIEGKRMTIKMLGYTLLFTVDSETSFSNASETWVRTGY